MSGQVDELRGSTPMVTAKDLLLEVRSDVKAIGKNVDILVSQNLDSRLNAVESWKDQLTGKMLGIALAVSMVTTALGIAATVIALKGAP